MHRVRRIVNQLEPTGSSALPAIRTLPPADHRAPLRWNGWGYEDSEFQLTPSGQVTLHGSRYLFSGKILPELRSWMEENVGINIDDETPSQSLEEAISRVPPAHVDEAFVAAIDGAYVRLERDAAARLVHGHGHTAEEMFKLRYGRFEKLPDVVVYPGSHEDVEVIVAAAAKHDVVLIPFGGGTTVSHALLCPEKETRMIVSLDMHEMCRIKWINQKSMLACIEAGVVGMDLERHLQEYGVTMGHEPDSSEFSTLGGWVATRASGMKKNRYGNIEDIVVRVKLVTPTGTIEKSCMVPRMSTGPDVNHMIMGSEGTLGVVTEVVVRLRPVPQQRTYGSIVFPDFEAGVNCLHEIAMKRAQPVSIRLVDNMQFKFGQSLKPEVYDWKTKLGDRLKKWYVLNHKGFDPDRMVAATLLFEGSHKQVRQQEHLVYEIAAKYGGMKAGEDNGIRGYFLTFMVAYLRDFGFNFGFLAESFETSVPWDNVLPLCVLVKQRIEDVAAAEGVQGKPFISCRVTQVYDTGACVYFYFGFLSKGLEDPIATFDRVEHAAREQILELGGSLSHHHGVGKLRKGWLPQTISETGIRVLQSIKAEVDPQNIMGNGNLIDPVARPGAGAE